MTIPNGPEFRQSPFSHVISGEWPITSAEMDKIYDEDRRRRLQRLQEYIQDPRGVGNIDSLLDTVQALHTDCDHPVIGKIKNIEMYLNRCESCLFKNIVQ